MRHVVRISDGLGNQMFQYAFAYALMRETGSEVILDPLFWGTSLRNYSLDQFNISISRRFVSEGMDYLLGAGPRNGRRFKEKYRNYLIKKRYNYVTEKQIMNYDEGVMHQEHDSFFMGFWQTSKYFDKYRNEIKNELSHKFELSDKAKAYRDDVTVGNSVALHIRRTDYVRGKDSVTLGLDFYKAALDYIEKSVGEYKLFVFSDDKAFVKEHFDLHEYTLVQGLDDLEEFEILRLCKHKVIANSTFSWWAAYLGENPNGLIVAPKVGIWADDYYPSDWKVIETAF